MFVRNNENPPPCPSTLASMQELVAAQHVESGYGPLVISAVDGWRYVGGPGGHHWRIRIRQEDLPPAALSYRKRQEFINRHGPFNNEIMVADGSATLWLAT